jgi:hypothetical protein
MVTAIRCAAYIRQVLAAMAKQQFDKPYRGMVAVADHIQDHTSPIVLQKLPMLPVFNQGTRLKSDLEASLIRLD